MSKKKEIVKYQRNGRGFQSNDRRRRGENSPSMWSTKMRWYKVSFRSCKSSNLRCFWISDSVARNANRNRFICIWMLLWRGGNRPRKRRRSLSSLLNAVPLLKSGLCLWEGKSIETRERERERESSIVPSHTVVFTKFIIQTSFHAKAKAKIKSGLTKCLLLEYWFRLGVRSPFCNPPILFPPTTERS